MAKIVGYAVAQINDPIWVNLGSGHQDRATTSQAEVLLLLRMEPPYTCQQDPTQSQPTQTSGENLVRGTRETNPRPAVMSVEKVPEGERMVRLAQLTRGPRQTANSS